MADFIRKCKSDISLYYYEDKLYFIAINSGVKIIEISDTEISLPINPMYLPQQITEYMKAGYYEFKLTDDNNIEMGYFLSRSDTDSLVTHIFRSNTVAYTEFGNYINLISSSSYSPNMLSDDLLTLYSIISKIAKPANKVIEFDNNMAFMAANNIKVCLTNQPISEKFALAGNNMWFLTLFKEREKLLNMTNNMVAIKVVDNSTTTYHLLQYRNTTGTSPNIGRIALHSPIYSCTLNPESLKGLLEGVKENEHNPTMVRFTTDGNLIVDNNISKSVVKIKPTEVPFSLDAILLQKCSNSFKAIVQLDIYNKFFTMKINNFIIIGGVKVGTA